MPATPRGRDAATVLAVLVALVLALAWLRSSDPGAPSIPAGVSVETVPAAVAEPSTTQPAPPRRTGFDLAARALRRKPGDRKSADRRGRPRRLDHTRAGRPRRVPPAMAPAPSAEQAQTPAAGTGERATGGAARPVAPEFALE